MNDNKQSQLSPDFLERIREILSRCTEREALVLRIRFGLDDSKVKTLEETAELLGVSRERVRQIENKAIRRHTGAHRAKKIKDFYC